MMNRAGDADLHFWITLGMARRQGISLNEMLSDGVLTRGDVAEMVARCRNCNGMQGCLAFLSEHPDRASAAPDWCRNAQLLAELRAIS
ncbi:MAG: DUF6455 family protein [Phaeovulum sp.]|uniref:DUF6455 family protein n=1 Tax=Phaeovulum sp. TaxID=2934796 RepID=UPI0027308B93|nr:DUF6455 family protein [Phaeovulum sp.]MDP2064256.1 DUF6455 family protein [Phaeovulum sp.]MDP3860504.1 DUF6455 family protein [Phaeovulum sp.]